MMEDSDYEPRAGYKTDGFVARDTEVEYFSSSSSDELDRAEEELKRQKRRRRHMKRRAAVAKEEEEPEEEEKEGVVTPRRTSVRKPGRRHSREMDEFIVDSDESVHSLPESEFHKPPPPLEEEDDDDDDDHRPPKHMWCEYCKAWKPESDFSRVQLKHAKLRERREDVTEEIKKLRLELRELHKEIKEHAENHDLDDETYCLLHRAWRGTGDQREYNRQVDETIARNLQGDDDDEVQVETLAQRDLREKRVWQRDNLPWPEMPSTEEVEAHLVPKFRLDELGTTESRKTRPTQKFSDLIDRIVPSDNEDLEDDDDDESPEDDDDESGSEAPPVKATVPPSTKRRRRIVVEDSDDDDGVPPPSNMTTKRRRRTLDDDYD